MKIYPAIDLWQGKAVRLEKGRFDARTQYSDDPLAVAQRFQEAGATYLHVVDLEGAKAGTPQQHALIARIASSTNLAVQAGGGIRTKDDVAMLFDAGVERVVLGSLAVRQPEVFHALGEKYPRERLVVSLDVRFLNESPQVAIKGWQETTAQTLWDTIEVLQPNSILCTSIDRDGMMTGPDIKLYEEFRLRHPECELLASGGVRDLDDIRALIEIGAGGAIVGKSIYEGTLDLREALQC